MYQIKNFMIRYTPKTYHFRKAAIYYVLWK